MRKESGEQKTHSLKTKLKQSSSLSAEYYVASLLFRLGYVVTITLGNTKEIDLLVYNPKSNETATIDVKGLKNATNWIMPKKPSHKKHHFYVLLTFKNKYDVFDTTPEVYTIPDEKVSEYLCNWTGRKDVNKIDYKNLKDKKELKGEEGLKQLFPT